MKRFPFSRLTLPARLATMLIALALLCLIAFEIYRFVNRLSPVNSAVANSVISTQTRTPAQTDIGQLAASHLFGSEAPSTPQYQEAKEDKSLNLTLRGIVANASGISSLAIIQSNPNDEETFALGDDVFNKGRLDFVAADHVILARSNGQLARLQLPEQDNTGVESEEFLPQAQTDYNEPAPVVSEFPSNDSPPTLPEPEPVPEFSEQAAVPIEPAVAPPAEDNTQIIEPGPGE